jgi:hypothetical protein
MTIVGMASSQHTLDIDTLTYQDLYLKSQTQYQISSYTIPVIPGGSNVYKVFQYFTPEQVLSTANLTFTPSTIPNISNAIIYLSRDQAILNIGLSTISSAVGGSISTTNSTINRLLLYQISTLYTSSYTQLINSYNKLQGQNIQTLNLQRGIVNLGNSISSISSQFTPNFSSLGLTLEQTFNQGPSVSTISSYVTQYYNTISTNIITYSTTIGERITDIIEADASTLTGYNIQVQQIIARASGPGVSTLSTVITSSFASLTNTVINYDPTPGILNFSTYVDGAISSLSSYFILESGISGICSISTNINRQYTSSILNAQRIAGTPGLCSISTFLTTVLRAISTNIGISQNNTISSFSTVLQQQNNTFSTALSTVGYTYLILQQESVSVSLSTLSTSFGKNYNNIASLSSFSTMLPSVYSTINLLFNNQSPYSTLQVLSTVNGSNTSTLNNYILTVYPQIFCGPGLSSFSTYVNPNFSSISTSLTILFSSFSNSVYNISSLRTDPGLCTLSTYVGSTTLNLYSSYTKLNQSVITITQKNLSIMQVYYLLSTSDSITYSTNNTTPQITGLSNLILGFSNYIPTSTVAQYNIQTSNISTFASTSAGVYISSLILVESRFTGMVSTLQGSYTTLSSVVQQNLYSPSFSTFSTNILTTSNLTINSALYASSIGIQTSTTANYTVSIKGNLQILNTTDPTINKILIGSNSLGRTSFMNSTVTDVYTYMTPDPGFTNEATDIGYNGRMWVVVGNMNVAPIVAIYYTNNPINGWTASTTIPSGLTSIYTVRWSGTYWLAGTSGTCQLIRSVDGITWVDASPPINSKLDSIRSLAWNGLNWGAVGINTATAPFMTIIYTDQNDIWQNAVSTFTGGGTDIATNGITWVATGNGGSQMKYSTDGYLWGNVNLPQLSTANAVTWNGNMFLAGGSNGNSSNLVYSYNGITWNYTPIQEISTVNSITWDGKYWNIAGTAGTLNKLLKSSDFITWSTLNIGVTTSKINKIGFASNTTPTIQLSNFDIFSKEIPVMMNSRHRLNIIHSTIYFNDGSLTIRKQDPPNETLANIGINTTYPEYALDIAVGNARKPAGTNWVTASDARVKTSIESADLLSCAKLVSEIPMRTYRFNKAFQEKTATSDILQYGFIAQEVKRVLPKTVSYTKEHGLDDFHSLDTDQIFKLEFGATQYLLDTVTRLEAHISTLESRVN